MVKVSVALCTFNGEDYLSRQLESIRTQSLAPYELIVCDDGSTDGTRSIVEQFQNSAPFKVAWISNSPQLGYRKNFLKAADLCSGDLVAFCDQDDIWSPDKLKVGSDPFSDPDVMLSYHGIELVDASGQYMSTFAGRIPWRHREPFLTGSPWIYGLGFTQIVRRSLCQTSDLCAMSIDQHNLDQPLAHDQFYSFLAGTLGTTVYLDQVLAKYRQHDNNVVGAFVKDVKRRPLGERIRDSADEYRRCAISCASRSDVLVALTERIEEPLKSRAREGARRYARLAEMFSGRSALYEEKTLLGRLNKISDLRKINGYADEKPWSFGRKAAIKDFIYCLYRR